MDNIIKYYTLYVTVFCLQHTPAHNTRHAAPSTAPANFPPSTALLPPIELRWIYILVYTRKVYKTYKGFGLLQFILKLGMGHFYSTLTKKVYIFNNEYIINYCQIRTIL